MLLFIYFWHTTADPTDKPLVQKTPSQAQRKIAGLNFTWHRHWV
jgi:hypothetical protein